MYIVSIIIPVYNVEPYISASLLSALNQTFDSIEYIIVDDCGTDKSMHIIQQIIENHQRGSDIYIYHHERNRGLSAARNTGMANVTGEYIFFMDSDDEITSDCIELHCRKMIEEDADFIIGNRKVVGAKTVNTNIVRFDTRKDIDILQAFFRNDFPASACNRLYKKHFIIENNFIFKEGLLYEDQLWHYMLARKAKKISVVSHETYLYKIRNNSITSTNTGLKKIDSLLYTTNYIVNDWEADGIPKELRKDFCGYLISRRFRMALLLLQIPCSYTQKHAYYETINDSRYLKYSKKNVISLILSLPFLLFFILIKPPYWIYKMRSLLYRRLSY
jgi:glycosyltransferase involved in cell wall biosynthesis